MNSYLLLAYGVMWLIIFAYIFSVDLRHIKLRKELSRIRTILDKYDPNKQQQRSPPTS